MLNGATTEKGFLEKQQWVQHAVGFHNTVPHVPVSLQLAVLCDDIEVIGTTFVASPRVRFLYGSHEVLCPVQLARHMPNSILKSFPHHSLLIPSAFDNRPSPDALSVCVNLTWY